jgi:hypothetical protein
MARGGARPWRVGLRGGVEAGGARFCSGDFQQGWKKKEEAAAAASRRGWRRSLASRHRFRRGAMVFSMEKSNQRREKGGGACDCILCHCQMGQDADIGGYSGHPRASGSPQKSPKFAPVLGQTGRCTCPFLSWVAPLGAGFVRKDTNGRVFAFGSAPLEMPLVSQMHAPAASCHTP